MRKSRTLWSLVASILIVAACYAASGGTTFRLIDNLFLVGMILLVVAGIYTVISGGFFSLFSKGFRAMFSSKAEKEYGGYDEPLGEEDGQRKERASQVNWAASIALITGLLITALSYLLTFLL
ncbi:DUF3899 domain-containing protein [Desmospora profundinema]|uniref:DUF3899 domain-containing protein n=1 Tax=Desmospora profundinema TaxID=1571184 RepID=A0ABU1INK1_9BACL|nr:DUF3899 domain-containing protein [Desmospora profundinema]MDR6226281.1 hypothetical protein [Desmospora profundinema]